MMATTHRNRDPIDRPAAPAPDDSGRPRSARRRRLIVAGAAFATASIAGCAMPGAGGAAPKGRVVVVGGGYGGATAARYLKLWGDPALQVTLVDRNAQFVSCPLSNLVVGGHRVLAELTRGYDGLRAAGVRVLRAEVAAVDAGARELRLADGSRLPYDRLVLSPGIDFVPGTIAGLDAAIASERVLHAWKAGPQTTALRSRLAAIPDGGVVLMSIPLAPYRCPPGPYERACLVASYLKVAKPRSKLIVCDANPDIQSKKALFLKAWQDHYPGLIDYRPNAALRELTADGTAKFEFEDIKPALLNVLPPMRAGDIARQAGAVNVNDRWCAVRWQTLESTALPAVHVLGDATMSAPAMPKSGHMANQHAKVAAAAILAALDGRAPNPAPLVMNTCYSFVTATDVVHVASVHQYDAADATFKAVPGSGGVSSAASELEGRYAWSWARNIWSDMLG
ncbi:MAG: NAD(P)/FAD-dependent oxidoreductase [Rubrivivax sp.]